MEDETYYEIEELTDKELNNVNLGKYSNDFQSKVNNAEVLHFSQKALI